jgi:SAM-dependent methyltransferase
VNSNNEEQVPSPFGGWGTRVREVSCIDVIAGYTAKCNVNVQRHLGDCESIAQYECTTTGTKFWRPASLAGDETFYAALDHNWPNYYKTDRWEYGKALDVVSAAGGNVLEVGCGRGYFLRRVESKGLTGAGLELNADAIARRVTQLNVWNETVEAFRARSSERFAVVCSFQVLEHVTDPAGFIRECAALLKPGGRLIFSTPNHDFEDHAVDPLDMPPHHMNHFTPDSFRRIGKVLDLEVASIDVQLWQRQRFYVYSNPDGGAFDRLFRSALNRMARIVAGTRPTPGPNLICVYAAKS